MGVWDHIDTLNLLGLQLLGFLNDSGSGLGHFLNKLICSRLLEFRKEGPAIFVEIQHYF